MKTLFQLATAGIVLFAFHGFASKAKVISYKGAGLIENIIYKADLQKFLNSDFQIQIDSGFFSAPKILYKKKVKDALQEEIPLLMKDNKQYYLMTGPIEKTTIEKIKQGQNTEEHKKLLEYIINNRWLPCMFQVMDGTTELRREKVELHVTL